MVAINDHEGGTSRWFELQLPQPTIKSSVRALGAGMEHFSTTWQSFAEADVVYSRHAHLLVSFRVPGTFRRAGIDGI